MTALPTPKILKPQLVNWDFVDDMHQDWRATGEDGMAVFLLVASEKYDDDRNFCCAGEMNWRRPEALTSTNHAIRGKFCSHRLIDLGMLIGSTKMTWFNDRTGRYFAAELSDLTYTGKLLYRQFETIYGEGSVHIVTVLDT